MVIMVEAIYEGGTYELQRDNQTGNYYADIKAVKKRFGQMRNTATIRLLFG